MAWTVYKITCLMTGKSYVGATKSKLWNRWCSHRWAAKNVAKYQNSEFHSDIRLHGDEGFSIVAVHSADFADEAYRLEAETIKELGTLQPNGYNLAHGGPGRPGIPPVMHADTKAKMSAAKKGKPLSEAHKANISAYFAGRKRPEISVAMLSKGAGSRSAPASGFTGVVKCGNFWMARMKIDGKTRYLGQDRTPEGASAIYQAALAKRLNELGGAH